MPSNSSKKNTGKKQHPGKVKKPKPKFKGVLNETIMEVSPMFIQAELDRRVHQERLKKLPALFQHYDIDSTAENSFELLAMKLAIDCVPGFQSVPYKVPTKGYDNPELLREYALIRQSERQNGGNQAKAIRDYLTSVGNDPMRDFDSCEKRYKRTRDGSQLLKDLLKIYEPFGIKTIQDLDKIVIEQFASDNQRILFINTETITKEDSPAGTVE